MIIKVLMIILTIISIPVGNVIGHFLFNLGVYFGTFIRTIGCI